MVQSKGDRVHLSVVPRGFPHFERWQKGTIEGGGVARGADEFALLDQGKALNRFGESLAKSRDEFIHKGGRKARCIGPPRSIRRIGSG